MNPELAVLEHKDSFLELPNCHHDHDGAEGDPDDAVTTTAAEGASELEREVRTLEYEMPSDHYDNKAKSLLYCEAEKAAEKSNRKNHNQNQNPWQEFVNHLPWNQKTSTSSSTKNSKHNPTPNRIETVAEEEQEEEEEEEDEDDDGDDDDGTELWKRLIVPETTKPTEKHQQEQRQRQQEQIKPEHRVIEWPSETTSQRLLGSSTDSDLQSIASSVTGPVPMPRTAASTGTSASASASALRPKSILKKKSSILLHQLDNDDNHSQHSDASLSTWNTNNTSHTHNTSLHGGPRRTLFANVPRYHVQQSKQNRRKRRRRRRNKTIQFDSTVRVYTDNNQNNHNEVKDAEIWWQPSEYRANEETAALLAGAVRDQQQQEPNKKPSVWNQVWQLDRQQAGGGGLTASVTTMDGDDDHALAGLEVPLDDGMEAPTVSWTWALFYGHSTRGLEHAVDRQQGRLRTSHARESVRAVVRAQGQNGESSSMMEEEEDKTGPPQPIEERIRNIYQTYSQSAFEQAQQRGQQDATAIETNPDEELQQQYVIYLQQVRLQRIMEREHKIDSAVLLQSWFRQRNARLTYQRHQTALVRLQSTVRMWLDHSLYQRQQHAAIRIQALARRYLIIVYMTMDPVLYHYRRNIDRQRIGAEDLFLMPVPEDEQEHQTEEVSSTGRNLQVDELSKSEEAQLYGISASDGRGEIVGETEEEEESADEDDGGDDDDDDKAGEDEDLRYWKVNLSLADSTSSMQANSGDEATPMNADSIKSNAEKSLENHVVSEDDDGEIPSLAIAASESWDTMTTTPPPSPVRATNSIPHEEKVDDNAQQVTAASLNHDDKREPETDSRGLDDVAVVVTTTNKQDSTKADSGRSCCGWRTVLAVFVLVSVAVIVATALKVQTASDLRNLLGVEPNTTNPSLEDKVEEESVHSYTDKNRDGYEGVSTVVETAATVMEEDGDGQVIQTDRMSVVAQSIQSVPDSSSMDKTSNHRRRRPLFCRGPFRRFCFESDVVNDDPLTENNDVSQFDQERGDEHHQHPPHHHHAYYHTRRWKRIHAHSEHVRHAEEL